MIPHTGTYRCTAPSSQGRPSGTGLRVTGEERQLLDRFRRRAGRAGDPSQPPRTKRGSPCPLVAWRGLALSLSVALSRSRRYGLSGLFARGSPISFSALSVVKVLSGRTGQRRGRLEVPGGSLHPPRRTPIRRPMSYHLVCVGQR